LFAKFLIQVYTFLVMKHISKKKVKIVATLGPASGSADMIKALAKEGVNVFRINMSHCPKPEVLERVKRIRAVERELGVPLSIMGDLMGPKIRIGDVEPGTELAVGGEICIGAKAVRGTAKEISLNFPTILKSLKAGNEIYIGDGQIKLIVKKTIPGGVLATVAVGGPLLSRKGFSAHGMTLKHMALTKKDREDTATLIEAGADAIAISFVQGPKDVEAIRNLLPKKNPPFLLAKIETQSGVDHADKILDVADGLMVARGDLGLSVPMADVPHIQKRLIALCLKRAKPVVTATQMLDSMASRPIPTRAEVTDVANAILDGTDGVMLSDETATGKFPVEVIRTMVSIIERATSEIGKRYFPEDTSIAGAIGASVVRVAEQIGAKLIVVMTEKGVTARRIARHRHMQPIIALSPHLETLRRLNFSWGVYGYRVPVMKSADDLLLQTKKIAKANDIMSLKEGDLFVVSASIPFGGASGTTNLALAQKV